MKCGCESEPLGELLKQFELDETHTFRLFIKPFMDARRGTKIGSTVAAPTSSARMAAGFVSAATIPVSRIAKRNKKIRLMTSNRYYADCQVKNPKHFQCFSHWSPAALLIALLSSAFSELLKI